MSSSRSKFFEKAQLVNSWNRIMPPSLVSMASNSASMSSISSPVHFSIRGLQNIEPVDVENKIRKIYSFAHCKLLKLARSNKVRRSPRWAKLKISLNVTWSLIKLALFVLIPRLPHIYNHTKHQAASPNPVLCNPTLKSHCAISL